jgi:hypothetical protein
MVFFIIIVISLSLSLLCTAFTIIHLKQSMLPEYVVLQLFCSYDLWYGTCNAFSHVECCVLVHLYITKYVCSAKYGSYCYYYYY